MTASQDDTTRFEELVVDRACSSGKRDRLTTEGGGKVKALKGSTTTRTVVCTALGSFTARGWGL